MIDQNLVNRYYELYTLLTHSEYVLSEEEAEEYARLCEDLLYNIMVENRGVFERLKDR